MLASLDAVIFPVLTLVSFLQELPDEKMHAHPRNLQVTSKRFDVQAV
jgi:hypothetical protein